MSLWDNLEQHEESLDIINVYIDHIERGLNLIGLLLQENNEQTDLSAEFDIFNELMKSDLLKLLGKLGHPQSASLYHELNLFNKKIEELIMFPETVQRKILAVGGGFSAGKSKLINLIIGEELLPTDTTPTTSIPTYVINNNHTRFFAHNIYGKKIELDAEAIKAITHAFSDKYNVSTAQMIKNILLMSPSLKFENIAILDTPGYSKSDHHKTELNKDEHLARVNLQTADYLVWVVDIEKGTIPNQDFEFIKSMNVDCPIFFVFNKADKKAPNDIKQIIEIARQNAINQGLDFVGIGAVSALLKKEYGGDRLQDFLHSVNKQKSMPNLNQEFLDIFKNYEDYYNQHISDLREQLKQLNNLALASSVKNEQDSLRPLIDNMKKKITQEKEKQKQIANGLQPYIVSLEKLQNLITKERIGDNDVNNLIRKKFLNHLLKLNIKKMIQDKLNILIKEITIKSSAELKIISSHQVNSLLEQALLILQKDIKLKIEKEMISHYDNFKKQIDTLNVTTYEKNELQHNILSLRTDITEWLEQYDFTLNKEKKLTDVLNKYNSISIEFKDLIEEMVIHESIAVGNHIKETMATAYQEKITSMLDTE